MVSFHITGDELWKVRDTDIIPTPGIHETESIDSIRIGVSKSSIGEQWKPLMDAY